MRIIFMGTPEFAAVTLKSILLAGHEFAAVYTRAPKVAGRGLVERKSPVHVLAEAAGVPVRTPRTLRDPAEQAAFASFKADVAVVVAYGLILPKPILVAPRHGCLNLHGSALPRWRGAAPIQRAIMAGDPATAVMVMRMDEGLDTGPVCLAETIAIGANMTAGELHDDMAGKGAALMVRALAALGNDSLPATPQPDAGVTYAAKIDKAEARIDFTKPAREVHNRIRGLSPFPGAWFEVTKGGRTERMKVLQSMFAAGSGTPGTVLDDQLTIACGQDAVCLAVVQRAGKKPTTAAEFLRGFILPVGQQV